MKVLGGGRLKIILIKGYSWSSIFHHVEKLSSAQLIGYKNYTNLFNISSKSSKFLNEDSQLVSNSNPTVIWLACMHV